MSEKVSLDLSPTSAHLGLHTKGVALLPMAEEKGDFMCQVAWPQRPGIWPTVVSGCAHRSSI